MKSAAAIFSFSVICFGGSGAFAGVGLGCAVVGAGAGAGVADGCVGGAAADAPFGVLKPCGPHFRGPETFNPAGALELLLKPDAAGASGGRSVFAEL